MLDGVVEDALLETGMVEHLHFDDDPAAIIQPGLHIDIGVLHALEQGDAVGIDDGDIGQLARAVVVEHGIEEAEKDILAPFAAEYLLEGEVCFNVEESHGNGLAVVACAPV